MKTITLHYVKNPDIDGGYWDSPVDPAKMVIPVLSLQHAQGVFEAWRDKNGLGGGNMARDCGEVREDGKVIARFSYNGRCWMPGQYPTPEILVAQASSALN